LVVVAGAALGAGEAADDALGQRLLVDLHLDHPVELLAGGRQHGVERLGLSLGAREAVQDEALGGIRLGDAVLDQTDHQRVGHQLAPLHDPLGLLAELAARGYRGAQHVAGRELDHALLGLQALRLGALSSARRSQKDDVHRPRPRRRAFLMRPSYWWASRCAWIWVTVSRVTETTIRRLVPPK